jgi:hypothetical protein
MQKRTTPVSSAIWFHFTDGTYMVEFSLVEAVNATHHNQGQSPIQNVAAPLTYLSNDELIKLIERLGKPGAAAKFFYERIKPYRTYINAKGAP